jgi:MYXO-CTERM domain-containing protein
MKPLHSKTLALLAVVTTSNLGAATVASWDWNTPGNITDGYTTPQAPGASAANVTVSNLGFGPGFGATFPNGTQNSLGGMFDWSNSPTLTLAIASDFYWTFTIQVASGYSLNLSSATVATGSGITNSPNALYGSFLMSSATGFTDGTQLGSGANGILWSPWGGGTPALSPYSVALGSVSALQDITSADGPIEFRVYMPTQFGERIGIQQMILDGAVTAVPEPSAALLGGLGALALLRRRRSA